jgi:hypothetical protein
MLHLWRLAIVQNVNPTVLRVVPDLKMGLYVPGLDAVKAANRILKRGDTRGAMVNRSPRPAHGCPCKPRSPVVDCCMR